MKFGVKKSVKIKMKKRKPDLNEVVNFAKKAGVAKVKVRRSLPNSPNNSFGNLRSPTI